MHQGRVGIWSVGFCGGRKTGEPGGKPSEQGWEPTTNSTHMWHQIRESNPGHSGRSRTLSPLHHPYSLPIWNLNVADCQKVLKEYLKGTRMPFSGCGSILFSPLRGTNSWTISNFCYIFIWIDRYPKSASMPPTAVILDVNTLSSTINT